MKKNKVYVNKINKKFDNNQNFCNVNEGNNIDTVVDKHSTQLTKEEKMRMLFNQNGYVFNRDVLIVTNNNNYHTRIAGKINNYLITLDRDIIDIKNIKDIIIDNK